MASSEETTTFVINNSRGILSPRADSMSCTSDAHEDYTDESYTSPSMQNSISEHSSQLEQKVSKERIFSVNPLTWTYSQSNDASPNKTVSPDKSILSLTSMSSTSAIPKDADHHCSGDGIDQDLQNYADSSTDYSSQTVINHDNSSDIDVEVGNVTAKKSRCRHNSLDSRSSIVDDLLFEIYERWHHGSHRDSFDSDTFTECSSTSEVFHYSRQDSYGHWLQQDESRLTRAQLQNKGLVELKSLVSDLQHRTNQFSSQLIKQLKRRDRQKARLNKNSDVVTAILQAASQKRRVDANMKFSIQPLPTEGAFDQWQDAMKAVTRLPLGMPSEFRKKVWLALADNHIRELKLDWEKTIKFTFNERSNPDDNALGSQIVKDLHRTGCSGFSGQDNEEDRAVLKRVLLAYARWNKHVGYCQGFNVLAALILEVVDRKEEDALKVMIYLIDHVLPENFFANNLRALSVDMAVFRDLLHVKLPKLSRHLDYLQTAAKDCTTGANYEPPLTNVFTMQWFLTLFATCLPKHTVLRVWDSIFLEGSEILLRTALAIWGRLGKRILRVESADEFYSMMGVLTQDMLGDRIVNADSLIKTVYSMAPMPLPHLNELREKYTYNITPFSASMNSGKKKSGVTIFSEEEWEDDDLANVTCFPGIMGIPAQQHRGIKGGNDHQQISSDMSNVSPGAYAANAEQMHPGSSLLLERMTTDMAALRKQYQRLKERQKQAHIIIANANARHQSESGKVSAAMPKIESPVVINHLFMGKQGMGLRNRKVTQGPRIAPITPNMDTTPISAMVRSRSNSSDSMVIQNGGSYIKRNCASYERLEALHQLNKQLSVKSDDDTSEVTEYSGMVSPNSERKSSISSLKSSENSINEEDENRIDNAEFLNGYCDPVSSENEDVTSAELNYGENGACGSKNTSSDSLEDREGTWSPICTVNKSLTLEEECSNLSVTESNNNYSKNKSSSSAGERHLVVEQEINARPCSLSLSPRRENNSRDTIPNSRNSHMDSKMAEYVAKLTYKAHKKNFQEREERSNQQLSPPSSPLKSPTSPSSSKPFNPFPSRHLSSSRAKNGIKLGLYKPSIVGNVDSKNLSLKNINRSHINSCLHRRYMTEVKGNKTTK